MAKRLDIFITALTLMILIAGCGPAEFEPAEPAKTENLKIESAEAEPNEAAPTEPNQIEPVKVEPSYVEPDENKSEQLQTEPDEVVPITNEPNDMKPAGVEPENIEPNDLKLNSAISFHEKCTDILKNHVDAQGMVNYRMLRRKRLGIKALLDEFDNLDPNVYRSWPKEDKIAFWLNAYNIQMLKIITDNYPIRSARILRLYPGWGPNSILHIKGIWTNYKFLVMDEEFTLAEIDKRFFRKEFGDSRIFFAISRASLSSPPLRNEPYYGHKLNEQLEDQTRKFISSPSAFRIDKENQKVYLSSLFQSSSYGKEFIDKFAIDKKFKEQNRMTRAVLNFITNYVSKDIVSFLEVGNYSVKFIKYDWAINDGS